MLDQKFYPAIDNSWIPSSTWRSLVDQEGFGQEKTDLLDGLPVMSATVLGLEMLLQEPVIDLLKVSDLILSDVGATIQILRSIGREYPLAAESPSRMCDCISSLDMGAWFGAMCAHTFACNREHSAATAIWKHCRLVAQYAQLVAESIDDISPEEAYLVGLLHEFGAIPTALGWQFSDSGSRSTGALYAIEGSLPPFVLAAMRSVNDSCSTSLWGSILTAAHELAGAWEAGGPSPLHEIDSMGITSRWKTFLSPLVRCSSGVPGAPGLERTLGSRLRDVSETALCTG